MNMREILSKNNQIIRYIVAGVLTTIVNYGIYIVLTISLLDVHVYYELQFANSISWIVAVVFAYAINHQWVFQSQSVNRIKEFVVFMGTRLLTLLLDVLIMALLVTIILFNDRIAKLISIVITTVVNYLLGKWIVFKET